MASEQLFEQITITNLAPGQTITVEHDLHINTTPVAPTVILCDEDSPIGVVNDSDVTRTHVTFTNTGNQTATAEFLLWATHTILGPDTPHFYWRGANSGENPLEQDVIIYAAPAPLGNDDNPGTLLLPVRTVREALSRLPCCWGRKCRIKLLPGDFDESASLLTILPGLPIGPLAEPLVIEGLNQTKDLTADAGWQTTYDVVANPVIYSDTLSGAVLAGATTLPITGSIPVGMTVFGVYLLTIGTDVDVPVLATLTSGSIELAAGLASGYAGGTAFTIRFDPIFAVTLTIPAAVPSFGGITLFDALGTRVGGELAEAGTFITPNVRSAVLSNEAHTQGIANNVTFLLDGNLAFPPPSPGDTAQLSKPTAKIITQEVVMQQGQLILYNVEYSMLAPAVVGSNFGGSEFAGTCLGLATCIMNGNGGAGAFTGPQVLNAGPFITSGAFGGVFRWDIPDIIASASVWKDIGNANFSGATVDGNCFVNCPFINGFEQTCAFDPHYSSFLNCFTLIGGQAHYFHDGAIHDTCTVIVAGNSNFETNGVDMKNAPGDGLIIAAGAWGQLAGLVGAGNTGVGVSVGALARASVPDDGVFFLFGFIPVNTVITGGGGDISIGVDVEMWTTLKGPRKGWTELVAQGVDTVASGNFVVITPFA